MPDTTERLLAAFRRAAACAPFYRQLLEEQGVDPAAVADRESFAAVAPLLDKASTFGRFPIEQMCVDGAMPELAEVLTSSGHGGRFSFGLSTRRQQAEAPEMIDAALDAAFEVKSRRTLAVNCLPMGVGFSSRTMTVATTSVREDMAVALIRAFGRCHDQIVLVSDPLFLRRLLDHAAEQGVDWTAHRVAVVVGEEIFGERFRAYVAARLGVDLDGGAGYIMSSFGVGELGLHLCHETRATIALRRAAFRDPGLARELFGDVSPLPMILAFDPRRTAMEAVQAGPDGYGRLAVSMLDPGLPVPLLRYQTGDLVRLLDATRLARQLGDHGVDLPGPLPPALLALKGREQECLPDGSHVGVFKDALYADPRVADRLTGAFRVSSSEVGPIVHVQLVRGAQADPQFGSQLRSAMQVAAGGAQVVVSPYDSFPYGMGLDYERKFPYYVPGDAPAVLA